MSKVAYNVNSMNSEDGTAHKVKEDNGYMVKSSCGVEFHPAYTETAESTESITHKCKRCWPNA